MSEIDLLKIASTCHETRIGLATLGLPYVSDMKLKSAGHGIQRETYRIRRRQRQGHQIIMTLSGSGWGVVQGKKQDFVAGSLWLIADGEAQDYGLNSEHWEILWFEFNEDSRWWHERIGTKKSGLQSHLWGESLHKVLMELHREQQQEHYATNQIKNLLAHQICLYLEREFRPLFTTPQQNEQQRKFLKMMERVRANLSASWTVEKLAEAAEFYVCQDHFIRISKTIMGQTPLQLVNEERMNKASELLSFSDYTLEQISGFIGYGNQFSFSVAFKRRYGVSPDSYRRSSMLETKSL